MTSTNWSRDAKLMEKQQKKDSLDKEAFQVPFSAAYEGQ
jgi:hypothetical protein